MMSDPRAENCRGLRTNQSGQITGVELQVRTNPDAPYELMRVELIDEAAAQGNTVASCTVVDVRGLPVAERVYLAWPWPDLTEKALPGNPHNQHMIRNGYTPPAAGPLALYVGDADGAPISDMVGGLGLPWNRHVSYRVTWMARDLDGGIPDDPDDDDDDGGNTGGFDDALAILADMAVTSNDTALAVRRIADALERLCAHLGAA